MPPNTPLKLGSSYFQEVSDTLKELCPHRRSGPQHDVWNELKNAFVAAEEAFKKTRSELPDLHDLIRDIDRFSDFLSPKHERKSVSGNTTRSLENFRSDIAIGKGIYRRPAVIAWIWYRDPLAAKRFYSFVSENVVAEESTERQQFLFASKHFSKIEAFIKDHAAGSETANNSSTGHPAKAKPTCFVIMPFTAETDRENQNHFRYVYNEILSQACEKAGFEPRRADTHLHTGHITHELLTEILTADVVLADLSRNNPNVMYELGIRHASKKPAVLVQDTQTESVFNIKDIRVHKYPDYALEDAELRVHIENIANALSATVNSRDIKNSPLSFLSAEVAGSLGDARVLGGRRDLTNDNGFQSITEISDSLDMVSLAAEVAMRVARESFRRAVYENKLKCRLVLYDPSDATTLHYDTLVLQIFDRPRVKRAQALDLLEFAEQVNEETGDPERIQIKLIRGTQLFHNLWIGRNSADPKLTVSHVSIYGYNRDQGGPAFRSYGENTGLFASLTREFDYIWNELAVDVDIPTDE